MADLVFKTLSIHDFKNFNGTHKLELARKPGLYHILGRNLVNPELGANGVGKSSIWDALFWNLFGKTIRDGKPGAAIEPRNGNNKTNITLEFERGGHEYTLERERNPNTMHLYDIGPPHDSERGLVQEDVPPLLGMSAETFRRTVILGQFGTLFLDLRPDMQAQMFSEALDLDIWLAASTRASIAAKTAATSASTFLDESNSLKAVISELSAQIKDAQQRADAFTDSTVEEMEQLTTQLSALQKRNKRLGEIGNEPPMPKYGNKRMAELLDLLREEPDKLEDALFVAGRKASADEQHCSKCKQPLPNTKLAAQLKAIRQASQERETAWREEMKQIDEERRKRNLEYQKQRDAWWLRAREADEAARDEAALHKKIQELDRSENEAETQRLRLKKRRKVQRERLEEIAGELEEANTLVGVAEFWTKAFKEIRLGIIDDALVELEIAVNRHAEALGLQGWRIAFETERESKAGNVSYAFNVLIYPPGESKSVKWESYSGGESQRWQLAVAFGLSEVLLSRAGISSNIEVLDEPTRGLSPEGIGDLLSMLRDRAIELGRAVYVVDHHALDRGAFDGMLLVTKKRRGSSFKWL